MHYTFCSRTDPGRLRPNNEDAVLVDEDRGLAVLADGMGGYKAGEVASAMAVAAIGTSLGAWLSRAGACDGACDLRQAMAASAAEANRAILAAAQANPAYHGMGTTLVVAVFRGEQLLIGHIGDSRAYRWRGQRLEQLTRDHSLLQEQLDAGLITPEQAAVSVHRNLVTRALGIAPDVALEIHAHAVEPGDCYLLCSDGLTDMLADGDIAALLGASTPSPAAVAAEAAALIAQANARGGRDNISVLLAQAAGEPRLTDTTPDSNAGAQPSTRPLAQRAGPMKEGPEPCPA